jgi:7,8-dihydroneopterin aldolase/epimerase/oxygenase
MRDTVIIEGLKVDAVIGIYEWEKSIQQPLLIDLQLAWNNRKPGHSDAIEDALDYAAVCDAVTRWVQAQPVGLIEKVAEDVAAKLQQQFAVSWVAIKVAKPTAIEAAKTVAVYIERGQREAEHT